MAGLFDFVKEVGRKLFNNESEANSRIKNEIQSSLQGIENLTVDYKGEDGSVKLGGIATNAEAMEKAVLIAGNIQGVSSVNVDDLKLPEGQEKEEKDDGTEYYVVQAGDTLSGIAERFYKDSNLYNAIFEANREVIKDANLIFPGQKIRIPKD